MNSSEYKQLVDIAGKLRPEYEEKYQIWQGSPFAWIRDGIPSGSKGKIGEHMVSEFLKGCGFEVSKSPDSDADLVVGRIRVEVKLSTLWKSGIYKFQQIRDQNYDVLFCLGISPHEIHAWVTHKSNIAWEELANQHRGKRGSDTWWINFQPAHCPHTWMRPQNGDLTKICDEFRKIIAK